MKKSESKEYKKTADQTTVNKDVSCFCVPHFYKRNILCLGAYKNKKAFLEAYKVACEIDFVLADAEYKREYNEQVADIRPVSNDSIEAKIAFANAGQIILLPLEAISVNYWKKYIENLFDSKFVDAKTLNKLNDVQKEFEDAKRYRKLKEKIITLSENLKEDEVGYLV